MPTASLARTPNLPLVNGPVGHIEGPRPSVSERTYKDMAKGSYARPRANSDTLGRVYPGRVCAKWLVTRVLGQG